MNQHPSPAIYGISKMWPTALLFHPCVSLVIFFRDRDLTRVCACAIASTDNIFWHYNIPSMLCRSSAVRCFTMLCILLLFCVCLTSRVSHLALGALTSVDVVESQAKHMAKNSYILNSRGPEEALVPSSFLPTPVHRWEIRFQRLSAFHTVFGYAKSVRGKHVSPLSLRARILKVVQAKGDSESSCETSSTVTKPAQSDIKGEELPNSF
eukprot:scaffold14699_cov170-Amphora_coffeaeformis.AAC.14